MAITVPFLNFNVESKILNANSIFKRAFDQIRAQSTPEGKAYSGESSADAARRLQQDAWYQQILASTIKAQPFEAPVPTSESKLGTINEFVSLIGNRGLAVPNTFRVWIYSPWYSLGDDRLMAYETSLMAESTQIPITQLVTINERTYGPNIRFPFAKEFSPITITFYVDKNYTTKRFFDGWIDSIYDQDTRDLGFYKDYVGNITIQQLDKYYDDELYSIMLMEAYPTSVKMTDMNHASTNQFHRIEVTFSYSDIRLIQVDKEAPGEWRNNISQEMNIAAGLQDDTANDYSASARAQLNSVFDDGHGNKLMNMAAQSYRSNNSLSGYRPGLGGLIEAVGNVTGYKQMSSAVSNSVTQVTNATRQQLSRFGL